MEEPLPYLVLKGQVADFEKRNEGKQPYRLFFYVQIFITPTMKTSRAFLFVLAVPEAAVFLPRRIIKGFRGCAYGFGVHPIRKKKSLVFGQGFNAIIDSPSKW